MSMEEPGMSMCPMSTIGRGRREPNRSLIDSWSMNSLKEAAQVTIPSSRGDFMNLKLFL